MPTSISKDIGYKRKFLIKRKRNLFIQKFRLNFKIF